MKDQILIIIPPANLLCDCHRIYDSHIDNETTCCKCWWI